MPAGPVGGCWESGAWPDTAWEADAWAEGSVVNLLPDNIIVATVTVDEVVRTIRSGQPVRSVTFDG